MSSSQPANIYSYTNSNNDFVYRVNGLTFFGCNKKLLESIMLLYTIDKPACVCRAANGEKYGWCSVKGLELGYGPFPGCKKLW